MGLHCGIGFASPTPSRVLQKEEAHLESLCKMLRCGSDVVHLGRVQFCLLHGTFHTSDD
uniref:Uncharacterized protein n=1 Tax=Zea mays TaxID=4577 RepID=C0PNI8_MAIZE|nr:unknown [Zea mays]